MKKQEIRSVIEQRLAEGHPKGAIFESLRGQGLSDRRLAVLMATRPHPVLVQRHAGLIKAMLVISWLQMAIAQAACLWVGFKGGFLPWLLSALFVGGLVYLFIWGFQRNRAWAYTASIVLGIASLPGAVGDVRDDPLVGGLGLLLSLALLAFTWHVRGRLFPDLTLLGARKLDGEYRFVRVWPEPHPVAQAEVAPVRSFRTSPPRWRLVAWSSTLVLVASGAWVFSTHRPEIRDYHHHLTTAAPEASFHIGFLSGDWTESDLRDQLGWLQIQCQNHAKGPGAGGRACFADVRAYNQVPAMSMVFFFTHDRLDSAAVRLPSWEHEGGLRLLFNMLGAPLSAQGRPVDGVRLVGWRLEDGGAVFYNRDRPVNPLSRNAIQWVSARHCERSGCFRPKTPAP